MLTLVVAVVVAGSLVLLSNQAGPAEWLFGTFLIVCGGYVVRAGLTATRRAASEGARAARLAQTEPGAAARAAIREERRRLGGDIAGVLRDTLDDVLRAVRTIGDGDPRPALARVHEHAQLATSELRRHLGLLRAPGLDEPSGVSPASEGRRPPRRDQVLAGALALLAAAETTAYAATEHRSDWLPWSPALSALAAATVVGRTVAPGVAATACAGLFALGTSVGYPVAGGFWVFGTLGALLWAIARGARAPSLDLGAGLLLVAAVLWTRRVDDSDNVFVFAVIMAVAMAGGLVVRLAGNRETSFRAASSALEVRLRRARTAAVEAERAVFARELHDVVSHAVGLIAVQAGAAQVCWPHDPAGVRRAVEVIEATAAATLAELERLLPGAEPATRDTRDLHALVGRIRAAGTMVDLTVVGEPGPSVGAVVYRVVQECLTNVVRHAPGAAVRVDVRVAGTSTTVEVVDDGPGEDGRAPESAGSRGYGLVGLAERVAFAGGTLQTGRRPDGRGFEVRAVLPARDGVLPGATGGGVTTGSTGRGST